MKLLKSINTVKELIANNKTKTSLNLIYTQYYVLYNSPVSLLN